MCEGFEGVLFPLGDMAKDGAGFAGFASWLDMTPADPDVLAIPDPASLIQLPWKREVGWLAADPYMNGKAVIKPLEEISKSKLIKYNVKFSEKDDRGKADSRDCWGWRCLQGTDGRSGQRRSGRYHQFR